MKFITNPILPGFNPDPSILRVGDDYYIATSTFEWFPGVQIHHSRDLTHWRLLCHPLNRLSQLNMQGNPASGGVWAPCLSYSKGVYYLVYTDVKFNSKVFKDTHNYLVTADDPMGPWSEPVYLNSSGFDPSLFHDDDGRKWLVNMVWDFRNGKNSFAGIALQEYSESEQRLTGSPVIIYKGTDAGFTEGPHLYRRNGYYYLMTAEGGTFWNHQVTMARSRSLFGPYETDPNNPILTSKDDRNAVLRRAGHGSLVQTQSGEYYLAYLCGRPVNERCIMGRETAITAVEWTEDGWLRLSGGGNSPQKIIKAPDLPDCVFSKESERDDFDSVELGVHYQTLRIPLDEDCMSLKERPGYLRLKGRESLYSNHVQSLVARRQQAFRFIASTCIEFEPDSFQQMAGLIYYYDRMNFYYLMVTWDEQYGRCLKIMAVDNGSACFPAGSFTPLPDVKRFYLRAQIDYDVLRFYYSIDGDTWKTVGSEFDTTKLSDEYYLLAGETRFTGAFIGLCCQDLSGSRKAADFDYFDYSEETD